MRFSDRYDVALEQLELASRGGDQLFLGDINWLSFPQQALQLPRLSLSSRLIVDISQTGRINMNRSWECLSLENKISMVVQAEIRYNTRILRCIAEVTCTL